MELEFNWVRFSRNAEYAADMRSVAARSLTDPEISLLMRFHVREENWIQIEPGDQVRFFRKLYRAEEKLGAAIAALRPYSLYPVAEYFSGVRHEGISTPEHLASPDRMRSTWSAWSAYGRNPD